MTDTVQAAPADTAASNGKENSEDVFRDALTFVLDRVGERTEGDSAEIRSRLAALGDGEPVEGAPAPVDREAGTAPPTQEAPPLPPMSPAQFEALKAAILAGNVSTAPGAADQPAIAGPPQGVPEAQAAASPQVEGQPANATQPTSPASPARPAGGEPAGAGEGPSQ